MERRFHLYEGDAWEAAGLEQPNVVSSVLYLDLGNEVKLRLVQYKPPRALRSSDKKLLKFLISSLRLTEADRVVV